MKIQALLILHLLGFAFLCNNLAQADDIDISELPQVVLDAIQAKYPDAEIDDAETNGDDEGYEIDLDQGDDEIKVEYRSDGTFVYEERELDYEDLPAAVTAVLEKDFAESEFGDIEEQQFASGKVIYDIDIEYSQVGTQIELRVDSTGTVLRREESGGNRDRFSFRQRAGELDILLDGKLLATYVWSDPDTTRPYFKQIHALGGETQITRNHPPQPGDFQDHETYHPGIWWGFGDVGGNDYWRMKAKIIGGTFVEEPTAGKNRAAFAVRNRMLVSGGEEKFCDQLCRYTLLRRPNGILMICESTISREESDFWLGDQEEMGLAIRVATSIATDSNLGGVMRDSEGRTDQDAIRTNQSDWCDYSGPVDGKQGGILLMNDPKNFRKPWWHAVETGLLIANPLGESELNGRGKQRENVLVKKGQPFRLCYGALIHLNDPVEPFDPAEAYQEFLDILPQIDNREKAELRSDLPIVPEGFDISIFAQEPRVYKPTAICFDARGRLTVGQGPQYPKNYMSTPTDSVLLMIDTNDDGVADESKTFATGFNSVQGLAWKGNDLYVANAPELTIVRDLDGDDEADEYVIVYTDLGNREHALHGLNWGPDGKLYMSKGNSKGHNQPEQYGYVAPRPFRELWDVVDPPGAPDAYPPKTFDKRSYQKTYHHWADDWGREGGILRCDPLGSNLEIVTRGLRNPWDITFDDQFNLLGTDNDQEQGDRIMMPFYGAHFGWGHSYSSHWTGEDHLPTAPVSGPVFHGSGTGIIYYTHPHFPSKYRNVFFMNDWANGTYIYRPVWDGPLMQPQGGRWESFATRGSGEMVYRPTDMECGPDGAIYICGWGGDYHYNRDEEGSWMFRVTHTGRPAATNAEWNPPHRRAPQAAWNLDQLLADLGSDALSVWRVNAQDELVRRGSAVRERLIKAVDTGSLDQGQQTWALWALGRMASEDKRIDAFFEQLASVPKTSALAPQTSLNLRIQALRILAYRANAGAPRGLPQLVVGSLSDPEPRIRFEAIQALWQAKQTHSLSAIVDLLAREQDRLVFYVGWRTLGDLADIDFRKQLLQDERARVRLAGLLSLLEGHEVTLNDVVAIAERDEDEQIQHWAMTWAMNPQPPPKMPNSTARVELEESVSMVDLIDRARSAKNGKLRQLFLSMISRATYGDDKDWRQLRDFYQSLSDDNERALVIIPLARENAARDILWKALDGNAALRHAAVRGFATLSRRSDDSPQEIAEFLLSGLDTSGLGREQASVRVLSAVEALSHISLPTPWRPAGSWDSLFSHVFQLVGDVGFRSKILTLLLAIDPQHVANGIKTKQVLEQAARDADPRLYAGLVSLKPRLGLQVELTPPEQATIDQVLALLPGADPKRGRELFFSDSGGANCAACHRIAGRGTLFAPELSGIGIRAEAKKIAESILNPSATIAEGFQLHNFVMDYGMVLSGAVLRENNVEIQLIKTDGTLETIETQAVEQRVKTKLSAMPNGFALLGNEQIADLVAFLGTCRHRTGEPASAHASGENASNSPREITHQLTADADIDAVADHLLAARKTASMTRGLALHFPDLDRGQAYQIQMALLKKLESQGEQVVGWKMGGTKIAKPGQQLDPIFGFMLASDRLQSGSAAKSDRFADNTPIIEAEIGFWIARDLPGPKVSREELVAAVAGVGGASELISVRVRDAAGGIEAGANLGIADGLGHGGFILPERHVPLDKAPFDSEVGRVVINGQLEAEGAATQMMEGAPLDAVLSLANQLPKHGRYLRAGDVVIIGSLLESPPAKSGDRAEITFSTFEPLTIEFE